MDLQLSVFLLFILFTGGHSLSCYECISQTGSCTDQEETTCPEDSTCISSVILSSLFEGNLTTMKTKGCVPSNSCQYTRYNTEDFSFYCCNEEDLCNAEDAELSPSPNGKQCYYCIGEDCSNIMDCLGSQDRCLKATVTIPDQTTAIKGCASKSICDNVTSIVGSFLCCEESLCNSAQSVPQRFLFLCCSLLSYFLLH